MIEHDPAGLAIMNAIHQGNLFSLVMVESGAMGVLWRANASEQLGELARRIGRVEHTDPVVAEWEAMSEVTVPELVGGLSPVEVDEVERRLDVDRWDRVVRRRRHGRGR